MSIRSFDFHQIRRVEHWDDSRWDEASFSRRGRGLATPPAEWAPRNVPKGRGARLRLQRGTRRRPARQTAATVIGPPPPISPRMHAVSGGPPKPVGSSAARLLGDGVGPRLSGSARARTSRAGTLRGGNWTPRTGWRPSARRRTRRAPCPRRRIFRALCLAAIGRRRLDENRFGGGFLALIVHGWRRGPRPSTRSVGLDLATFLVTNLLRCSSSPGSVRWRAEHEVVETRG